MKHEHCRAYVVAVGSAERGFDFYGPFKNKTEAEREAQEYCAESNIAQVVYQTLKVWVPSWGEDEQGEYIVAFGNFVEGTTVYGFFSTRDSALDFAEFADETWVTLRVNSPQDLKNIKRKIY